MLEVLQSEAQFAQAREALEKAGHSALESGWRRRLQRLHLLPGLAVGEFNKSWDVARTLGLIRERLGVDAPVLDLGAYCSEIPVALAKAGYRNVHGIDLNPDVRKMPGAGAVQYAVGDFMHMPYADASFDAVTAISVIEHGYDPERLLREISRVLRPGGLFIASFDYWPQKIDTGSTTFFGLSWLIFSEGDFRTMLEVAARNGLRPLGAIDPQATQRPVHCAGFDYTFAWTVLQKD